MAPLAGVTAIRFVLAGGLLGAAIAAGATERSAVLGFALGLAGGAFFVLADPRRRLMAHGTAFPRVKWWQAALWATYPSTVGLAVLSAISLAFSAVLAAVLAGVIGGLGLAGVLTAVFSLAERR